MQFKQLPDHDPESLSGFETVPSQFKDSDDLFMENQEKNAELEAKDKKREDEHYQSEGIRKLQ